MIKWNWLIDWASIKIHIQKFTNCKQCPLIRQFLYIFLLHGWHQTYVRCSRNSRRECVSSQWRTTWILHNADHLRPAENNLFHFRRLVIRTTPIYVHSYTIMCTKTINLFGETRSRYLFSSASLAMIVAICGTMYQHFLEIGDRINIMSRDITAIHLARREICVLSSYKKEQHYWPYHHGTGRTL